MRPLIYQPNPFAVPQDMPGFDPAHPAAQGMSQKNGLSAVAFGGTFLSLLTSRMFLVGGSPSAAILGALGYCINFPTPAGADTTSLAGQSTTSSPSQQTLAAIIQFSTWTPGRLQSIGSTLNGGNLLSVGYTNQTLQYYSSGNQPSSITISANTPYFVAASQQGTAILNYVAVNLRTGAVQYQTLTSGLFASSTFTGTTYIGSSGNTYEFGGYIATFMSAPNFLPMPVLLQWAARPWDFWHPPAAKQPMFMSLRAPLLTTRGFVQGRIIG